MTKLILVTLAVLLCEGALLAAQPPLKVCLISGAAGDESDASLAAFQQYLEGGYNAQCTLLKANGPDDLPGLEALDDADVALFFVDHLTISGEQLARIKDYCEAGRPVVAIRTSIQGFANWPEFGPSVLGATFAGETGPEWTARLEIDLAGNAHPIRAGLDMYRSTSTLYQTVAPPDSAVVILSGTTPVQKEALPAAWARQKGSARAFYTSVGSQDDFDGALTRRMVANALFWAAGRDLDRFPLPPVPVRPTPQGTLHLNLLSRTETSPGSGQWEETVAERDVPMANTAIIIIDMWDRHWDPVFTAIVGELATRMNPVLRAARDAGIQIIHGPSEEMTFYRDTPMLRRVELAPHVDLPTPLELTDYPLPIDGGRSSRDEVIYANWTRQTRLLDIGPYDAIGDDGQKVYNFLRQQNINTVIFMGVASNMCLLNKPAALKAMKSWGLDCLFVRDMTAAFYDPKTWPYVTQEKADELMVQYIEKYWAPSMSSAELIEGLP